LGPYGGRGLGLTICRHFVELHGGTIRVKSTPEQGSTFSFSLPLSTNVVARPFREPWETWAHASAEEIQAAVGILSTDEVALNLIRRYLHGYHVVGLKDIEAARKLAARARLQALVAVDGFGRAALTEFELNGPELNSVPRIACPLHTHGRARHDLQVEKCLVKPIGREQLRRALKPWDKKLTRVAIVDDDPDMIRLLSRMIRSLAKRCQILTATDGSRALALLRNTVPQVVLLDLLMPGIDGYDVVDQMRCDTRLADIPVIAITAWGGEREIVTVGEVAVSRPGDLSVGEGIGYLRAILQAQDRSTSSGILGAPAA
jgi:CheY-like chemotaxis protein